MCGIAGILQFDNRLVSHEMLRRMSDIQSHRGPDADGFFVDGNIGMAHRRLSIIDLSTGHQPMSNAAGTLTIVFNGEIYNYIELRDELKSSGHAFRTNSDTEVILAAYEEWGISCQSRLNGMWAFAIWDTASRTLFLSRDRIGEKPLHYCQHGGAFLFSSEIKGILQYGVPQVPSFELLELYLTLGYIPAPHTFYKNIFKLRPGHCLIVKDGKLSDKEYWSFPQHPEEEMLENEGQVFEKFDCLLRDSVRLRMRSDVPFGAFLSGGLDSASIVALMSGNTSLPVNTFTIGFDQKEYDERALARMVAEEYKTSHHEYTVEPGQFDESLQNTLFHYDEPFGDSSAIPTSYVSRFTSEHVKMALTGDGGDEVLSGYTIYQGEKFAGQYQHLPGFVQLAVPAVASAMASVLAGKLRYKLNRIVNVSRYSSASFNDRLISKLSWVAPDIIKALIPDGTGIMTMNDFLHEVMKDCSFKDPFYRLMYFQFSVSLPDRMLTKVDRMSMAHSLETRIPFLDYRLVEFMARVSKRIKMPGYNRKHVLRETVGKTLPPALLRAPKSGFTIPLREWFKGDAFQARLESLSNEDFGLRADMIPKLVTDNKQGKEDLGNFLWMLFLLKKWVHQTC